MRLLETKLRSSSLQSKHLGDWAISQDQTKKNKRKEGNFLETTQLFLLPGTYVGARLPANWPLVVLTSVFRLSLSHFTSKNISNPWDYSEVLGAEGAGRTKVCLILIHDSFPLCVDVCCTHVCTACVSAVCVHWSWNQKTGVSLLPWYLFSWDRLCLWTWSSLLQLNWLAMELSESMFCPIILYGHMSLCLIFSLIVGI